MIEELRKSKIFCLSSDYEGMSNAMIEAICVGLPIISTNVSGTEELIRDGENGFIVEVGGEERFTNCISQLISSPSLQDNMSVKNIQLAKIFNIDHIVDEWISLINKVVK